MNILFNAFKSMGNWLGTISNRFQMSKDEQNLKMFFLRLSMYCVQEDNVKRSQVANLWCGDLSPILVKWVQNHCIPSTKLREVGEHAIQSSNRYKQPRSLHISWVPVKLFLPKLALQECITKVSPTISIKTIQTLVVGQIAFQ